MDRGLLTAWVAGYERAWRTPDGPELDRALARLFAPDASYLTAPFERPYVGLSAIGQMWRSNRQGPDERFSIAPEVVAVDADRRSGVVRLEVRYGEPPSQVYRNLWVVSFDAEGRCTAFEEWPFWPPGSQGSYAHGPG